MSIFFQKMANFTKKIYKILVTDERQYKKALTELCNRNGLNLKELMTKMKTSLEDEKNTVAGLNEDAVKIRKNAEEQYNGIMEEARKILNLAKKEACDLEARAKEINDKTKSGEFSMGLLGQLVEN